MQFRQKGHDLHAFSQEGYGLHASSLDGYGFHVFSLGGYDFQAFQPGSLRLSFVSVKKTIIKCVTVKSLSVSQTKISTCFSSEDYRRSHEDCVQALYDERIRRAFKMRSQERSRTAF